MFDDNESVQDRPRSSRTLTCYAQWNVWNMTFVDFWEHSDMNVNTEQRAISLQ